MYVTGGRADGAEPSAAAEVDVKLADIHERVTEKSARQLATTTQLAINLDSSVMLRSSGGGGGGGATRDEPKTNILHAAHPPQHSRRPHRRWGDASDGYAETDLISLCRSHFETPPLHRAPLRVTAKFRRNV